MTGHLCLAIFLGGVTTGIGLVAYILHRHDKHLGANHSDQVGP